MTGPSTLEVEDGRSKSFVYIATLRGRGGAGWKKRWSVYIFNRVYVSPVFLVAMPETKSQL